MLKILIVTFGINLIFHIIFYLSAVTLLLILIIYAGVLFNFILRKNQRILFI